MPAQSGMTRCAIRRVLASSLLVATIGLTGLLSACTREDLVDAMATVVVELQATLEPLSATVEAGGLVSRPTATPESLTSLAPVLNEAGALTQVEGDEEAQPTPTDIPLPTVTPRPTTAPRPSPTPQPSPTPLPAQIDSGGSVMVLVPGGFFKMGAAAGDIFAECNTFRPGCDAAWFSASEPAHTLLLAPYYIDQYEVTNLEYLAFLNGAGTDVSGCGDLPCIDEEQTELQTADAGGYQIAPEQATHPVAGVTWFGAAAYCEWRGARLPTEAEWEKVALWNPTTESNTRYPWGDVFDGTLVNFCDVNCDAPQANADYDDGFAVVAPVGSYPDGRSPFGAYDMAGNVWEWVADWFGETYYADSATANPLGPDEGTERVVRGGSWFDTGNFTSGLIRFPSAPENADKTIGFRCATSSAP